MPVLVRGPVAVSVPATSANLGPGFDALGLALDLRDELTLEALPDAGRLEVVVDGEGAEGVPLDERHLVVRTVRRVLAELDAPPTGLRLTCRNVVPHARGLGSSSAAIVAGVWLARALVVDGERRLPDAAAFALAADLEGHPDNVAPAWFGGFTIAGRDAGATGPTSTGEWYAVGSAVDPRLAAVALVPPTPLSTEAARGLLPDVVPHAAAAADAGNAALLVAALAGAPEQLLRATRDHLHQEQRRPAMPASLALIDRLRALGVPAVVSGAGPTVLALVAAEGHAVPGLVDAATVLGHRPEGWRGLALAIDHDGVRPA
ncbi:homoserine kinase [Nocardioides sp. TRM66260-LWL]|uniref:homoserine kinase n=1 Tax=Nocardioides sp. TRM66260-LWL TaxID=2874478 RepID=UPI001CC64E05|nr:homoserine kinase [Nocardioides sp. TRM66260-LWL]MBZ5734267.1 homoserine kinase [Nocardioides sp. TRM66260-LWL]